MTSELENLYRALIVEMAKVEGVIITHLPALKSAATAPQLREALTTHLAETRDHEQSMLKIAMMPVDSTSAGIKTSFELLMTEAVDTLQTLKSSATIDAFIVAACSTVEHIEMSKYETLIEWSGVLEDNENHEVFEKIYASEKAAAHTLHSIGVGSFFSEGINMVAVNDLPPLSTTNL